MDARSIFMRRIPIIGFLEWIPFYIPDHPGKQELWGRLNRLGACQCLILTSISVACYSLVDKIAVGHMKPVVFAYVYPWVSLSLFTGYIFKVKAKGVLIKEWKNHKGSILVCGFLSIFGYFLILVAFTLERMSYIVGLRQMFQIFHILMPAGGLFICFEILQRNKVHRDFTNENYLSTGVAFLEIHSGGACYNLNSHRWHAHPNNLTFF